MLDCYVEINLVNFEFAPLNIKTYVMRDNIVMTSLPHKNATVEAREQLSRI